LGWTPWSKGEFMLLGEDGYTAAADGAASTQLGSNRIYSTVKLRLDLLLSSAFVSFCPKIDQDSCLGAAL
jgi:hypothetical protein